MTQIDPIANPAGNAIPDVQGSADRREIAIDKVGVSNVSFPIRLRTKSGGSQSTVSSINMYVSLPHDQKGTHMSRFLEVLNEQACEPIATDDLPEITRAIRDRLEAQAAHFEAEFVYFIQKAAPVTGMAGLMDYKVRIACEVDSSDETDVVLTVAAPAASLCPCSKEISDYGAHNQRCEITASVRTSQPLLIEDLVEKLEAAASAPVYAVLKRPDEKFVTEQAYDNPKFVEDIIRDLALSMDEDANIVWYRIQSENFESIHSHNAFAQITRDKRNA